MKNFIFISPNFPTNYWIFCRELKANGVNVLGIGDCPYDHLMPELKENLTEYFKVDSLENNDQVYRAVAFFIFKYGRVDWIESNNEYWLERDARLRTAYDLHNGFRKEDIPRIKYKSQMKEYFQRAGMSTARYHIPTKLSDARKFVKETGYPVIAKPDNGVGASHTIKISNDRELQRFFKEKSEDIVYIMEEFINGEVNSYDAIIDSKGEPLFEAGNVTPNSIMDIVNEHQNCMYHILKKLPEDIKKAGRAVVKSFGVKSRFVHLEFFRLSEDMEGIGKKGELVALEVNMRPSGGFTPDMINFAHSTNVYKIWADMIAFDSSSVPVGEGAYCAYVGRRDGKAFKYDHEKVMKMFEGQIKMAERIPNVLSDAMGDQMYAAVFSNKKEMDRFYQLMLKEPRKSKGSWG